MKKAEAGDLVRVINNSSRWNGYIGKILDICCISEDREPVYKVEMPGKYVVPFLFFELEKVAGKTQI